MTLRQYIQANNLQFSSAEEILALLNEKRNKKVDSTLRGMTTIGNITSVEEMEQVAATLDAMCNNGPIQYAMREYREMLRSNAVDFSLDKTQGLILSLASTGGWSDDLKTRIMELGVIITSDATDNGIVDVTVESIQVELDIFTQEEFKRNLLTILAEKYNRTSDKIESGEITTQEGINLELSS